MSSAEEIEKLRAITGRTDDPDKPLTLKQKMFVDLVVNKGMTKHVASRLSGYEVKQGTNLGANVEKALAEGKAKVESTANMSKKRVMDGILEAIDMAKLKGDPFVMISGWKEVAKMCGYYEPIKHRLEIDARGKIVVEKLQTLSDDQLVALASGDTANIIEGEIINGDEDEAGGSPGAGET